MHSIQVYVIRLPKSASGEINLAIDSKSRKNQPLHQIFKQSVQKAKDNTPKNRVF
jgi:hypothetical protein